MSADILSAPAGPTPLAALARLPAPGDNLAIATRTLAPGQRMSLAGGEFTLDYGVLEGHRFAVRAIAPGAPLLSWGRPFGLALRPIPAGGYVCNAATLEALRGRQVPFELPPDPNFRDYAEPYVLDERHFRPGQQVPAQVESRSFLGYWRGAARGAGTRNCILLLGATSRTASYVRALERHLKGAATDHANLDGIVAVAHTEGAGPEPLNNAELLLRAMAGFVVHPNTGAVLIVDDGAGALTNATLRQYLVDQRYPLAEVVHRFFTLSGAFEADLEAGAAIVRAWLPAVSATGRTPQPAAHLSLALQCGGSDAFSGVSANPLAAAVAREVVRLGGAANLAETTELMGAEDYLLQNVRNLDTARASLAFMDQFKELMAWHGVTAEGNPSGGNRYRGLYNIILKSLGAATKRDPAVRLDYAVDYAQRMRRPGFYFMNTPGNDLESIAGQVAGGSNLIIFTTGNGSITNFPFVPTLKIMTTTARYRLLEHEMDVNAGAYLDGTPLEDLARETLELALSIASGTRSKGELAGHSQVSLWRNWRQTGPGQVQRLLDRAEQSGHSLPIRIDAPVAAAGFCFTALRVGQRLATDQVALILPTSLCAGQVARMAAEHFNRLGLGREHGLSRFVALVHTEGCGVAGHSTGALYTRTMLSYMTHPLVGLGLFLEHGCERTHNDFMRRQLEQSGNSGARYGWASIQMDGGLEAVLGKMEAWFRAALATTATATEAPAGLESLKLGLMSAGLVLAPAAEALARVTHSIVRAGGSVVLPQTATLLESPAYLEGTGLAAEPSASLGYGQAMASGGFHIMEAPSAHWVETLTGLGATGVEILLAWPGDRPAQGHPLVPMIQIAGGAGAASGAGGGDFDLILQGEASGWAEQILSRVVEVAGRRYVPKRLALGDVDFQMTRGLLGLTV